MDTEEESYADVSQIHPAQGKLQYGIFWSLWWIFRFHKSRNFM